MARANLKVSDDLIAAFVQAPSQNPPIRWIKAELEDVNICFVDKGPVQSDVENDLEMMKEGALVGSGPCFILFCLTPESERNGWVLIAYVPDNSKVRARMLYASGQEDVKRSLGHSNFVGSAHITDLNDISPASIRGTVKRDLDDLPLTEEELLAKEEVAHMASPTDARANAMGMVPFSFDVSLDEKFAEFSNQVCHLVEIMVNGSEDVGLGKVKGETLSKDSIEKSDPRFYLLRQRPSQRVYLIFSCPEGTKIRTRMVYSTCKQTLTHHLGELGINIDKQIELGDPSDIDDLIKLHDTPDENEGKIVQQNFSKPSRPGRGKARVMKKE